MNSNNDNITTYQRHHNAGKHHHTKGSALIIALVTISVLTLVASVVLDTVVTKYTTTFQAAGWQESLLAAEAGGDVAMMHVRNSVTDVAFGDVYDWTGKGWTDVSYQDSNGITVEAYSYTSSNLGTFSHGGEGATDMSFSILVDMPPELIDSRDRQWFRIVSVGTVDMPHNLRRTSNDSRDTELRRLDFRIDDWKAANDPDTVPPQASRTVEIIARPISPFRNAISSVDLIEMNNHNIVVDSYDSRLPGEASTASGLYDPAKRNHNGDVGTNGRILRAGNAQIYGDALTNGGTVSGAANVTGEQRSDYYQELPSPSLPAGYMSTSTYVPLTRVSGRNPPPLATLQASPTEHGARYDLSDVRLSGSDSIVIEADPNASTSYVEIYINGDFATTGNGKITVPDGVEAVIYVNGNLSISGNGVVNEGQHPTDLLLYGLEPPAGETRRAVIAGNGGFSGAFYAPNYDLELRGGGNADTVYGSFVANTVFMNGVTSVHYDEALADKGPIIDYVAASWFEKWKPSSTAIARAAN